MRKLIVLVALAIVAAVCLIPAVAGADVIYNTIPDTNPFSAGGGPVIEYTANKYVASAYQFSISGGDYLLDSVEVGALWQEGPKSLIVSLMADNGDSVGTLLASAAADLLSEYPFTWEIVKASPTDRPLLESGKSYWLAMEPGAFGTMAGLCNNPANIQVRRSQKNAADGSWLPPFNSSTIIFRVNGTPVTAEVVPEPSALILALLGGSGAMGGIMLRRKR